ncbi:hypothetical protein [Desulfolutivibrio sulfoxidireducens]|uniref:hypothetical protein n=1 Tax=Desulfolutivibrio sulfoxidireducens TaxID=2773299 RepID=UPI001FE56F65|nr:hypothetical protein [Desulfolutivibrio sulfoxidireducens]
MFRKAMCGFAVTWCLLVGAMAHAGDPGLAGWEKGGAYDRLFDVSESDSFKGKVLEITEITPMPGMAPGIGLVVEDKKDKRKETVHLGPKTAVDLDGIALKEGDMVKVVGAWAEIDGKDVIMAIKVKKSEDVELKVRRTKDGFPFWGMTPEELAKERSGQ